MRQKCAVFLLSEHGFEPFHPEFLIRGIVGFIDTIGIHNQPVPGIDADGLLFDAFVKRFGGHQSERESLGFNRRDFRISRSHPK